MSAWAVARAARARLLIVKKRILASRVLMELKVDFVAEVDCGVKGCVGGWDSFHGDSGPFYTWAVPNIHTMLIAHGKKAVSISRFHIPFVPCHMKATGAVRSRIRTRTMMHEYSDKSTGTGWEIETRVYRWRTFSCYRVTSQAKIRLSVYIAKLLAVCCVQCGRNGARDQMCYMRCLLSRAQRKHRLKQCTEWSALP